MQGIAVVPHNGSETFPKGNGCYSMFHKAGEYNYGAFGCVLKDMELVVATYLKFPSAVILGV